MTIITVTIVEESFQDKNMINGNPLNMMSEKNYLKVEKKIQYLK